jgi:hypothetical protein
MTKTTAVAAVVEGNVDCGQWKTRGFDSSEEEKQGSTAVLPVDAIDRGWRLAAAVHAGVHGGS